MSIPRSWPQPAGSRARARWLDSLPPIGNTVSMPKIDPTLYVTIGTAAKIADVTRFWMRQRVQSDAVPGFEIDGQWFALRSACEAYSRTNAGRPRQARAAKTVKPASRKTP